MKKFSSLIVLLLIGFPALSFAQVADSTRSEARADSLYDRYEEEQALDAYNRILERDPDHYRALWRASFLYSRVGNRKEKEEDQHKYFNRGIELAERALKVDSADARSNFVMAVAMGRKALISGARDRVAASREIKKYADRALRYDSTHAGAWHVLGRWHFKVANLSWIERMAANALFGGIPGDATNPQAAEAIRKAIGYNDEYVLYYHDLAMVYEEMGQEQKAREACRAALEKEMLTPDDPRLKKECRQWISEWK